MTGKERDKHLINFHSSQCGSTWPKFLRIGTIFNEGLRVFSEDRGTVFFPTSIYLFDAKESRLEMTAWEELGEVLLCDKQHPYGDCIVCFLQNNCKHNSNTRALFKIFLGSFPWQFSSSDSVLLLQGAWGGSLVRNLRNHMLGFIFGLSILSWIYICCGLT